jgi:16S rRNA (uracil1498-N3)-methyltransferase
VSLDVQRSPLGSFVVLSAEDSHHLTSVLRLQVSDRIELADTNSGRVFIARITEQQAETTVCLEEEIGASSNLPRLPSLTLLCALCKGEKNDLITDWATELGCSTIIFFQGDHSVVKLKTEEDRAKKTERFAKIGLAAAKQSRQTKPPRLLVEDSLASALKAAEAASSESGTEPRERERYFCSLSPSATRLTSIPKNTKTIQIVIGPEGDFSSAEELRLCEAEYVPITLGERVLRSELAVVSALVSIQQAFDL